MGSEENGIRPALVIQNDKGNKYSNTVIVASITTKNDKKHIPTHYKLNHRCRIKKDSLILLEQIRAVDKKRVIKYICKLSDKQMKEIDKLIHISLGLECNDEEK
ncbi:MAG: type II toxin-antitoxin system PemK/MazF family toxin [Oscillospiraceae bacterium]|nr:type II toxin-antitoxin system PemK/MazF family toxin [Oscillospiraceae bacterium]